MSHKKNLLFVMFEFFLAAASHDTCSGVHILLTLSIIISQRCGETNIKSNKKEEAAAQLISELPSQH